MAATLHRLVPKVRLEKARSNFDSASGNVGVWALECEDRSVGIEYLLLISDTAVTTSHFNNWDDGEDLPIGTKLIDQASSSPNIYHLTSTDTWQEIGDIT